MTDAMPQGKETEPGLQADCFSLYNIIRYRPMNKLDIKQIKTFLLDDIWRVTDDEVSKKRG